MISEERKELLRALRSGLQVVKSILDRNVSLLGPDDPFGKRTGEDISRGGYIENGHSHDLYLDENGNGVTSIVNGHFHFVESHGISEWPEFDESQGKIVAHFHYIEEVDIPEEVR